MQTEALAIASVAVGAAGGTLAGQAAAGAVLGRPAVRATLAAGFPRGAQAVPGGWVAGRVADAVTELLASLAVRSLLAACLAALAVEPSGTAAAAGDRVTACSMLTVAALPAARSMETRGTTVLAKGPVVPHGAAAGSGPRVTGGVVQAGATELAIGTVRSRRAF